MCAAGLGLGGGAGDGARVGAGVAGLGGGAGDGVRVGAGVAGLGRGARAASTGFIIGNGAFFVGGSGGGKFGGKSIMSLKLKLENSGGGGSNAMGDSGGLASLFL